MVCNRQVPFGNGCEFPRELKWSRTVLGMDWKYRLTVIRDRFRLLPAMAEVNRTGCHINLDLQGLVLGLRGNNQLSLIAMAVDALPFQFSANVVDQDVVWFSVFSPRVIGHSQLRISRLKLFYRRQLKLVFCGGQNNRRLSLARSIQADTHVRTIGTEALPTQGKWTGELQRLRWVVKLHGLGKML